MALTVTDRGTGGSSASESATTVTPASNLAAGSTGVLCVAADNANATSTNFPTSITDSVGNVWSLRSERVGTGLANSSLNTAVYNSILTAAFTTSDSLVITYTAASVVSKAWTLSEISSSVSGGFAMPKRNSVATVTTTGTPTLTTTIHSTGDAIIGYVGAESTDTFAGDADSTNGTWSTHQHTGFGAGAAAISITSQSKVVTAYATQQYNPTLTSADTILGWLSFTESNDKVRAINSNNNSEASSTLLIRLPLAAGSFAVLCAAADNAATGGGTQNLPNTGGVTDTQGNTWTLRQTALYDPVETSAGAEMAIYTSLLTTSLTTTDTLTVTYISAAVTGKAFVLWEFTDATGYDSGGVGTGSQTGTPSVTTGSILLGNYVVGMVAAEGLTSGAEGDFVGDSDSTNGSWSVQARECQGLTTAAMAITSQWKKVTATATQTYNPTMTSCDQIMGWIELTAAVIPDLITEPLQPPRWR